MLGILATYERYKMKGVKEESSWVKINDSYIIKRDFSQWILRRYSTEKKGKPGEFNYDDSFYATLEQLLNSIIEQVSISGTTVEHMMELIKSAKRDILVALKSKQKIWTS